MDTLTLIFIGRSGCGKGTQAELLKEYLEKTTGKEVICISTGDKMREVIGLGNATSRLIDEKIMKAGSLAPPALAVWAWMDAFIREGLDNDKHLILDGTPRTASEAEVLIGVLNWYERQLVIPIVLEVSEVEVTKRMLARGRADDTAENIKNRLAFYDRYVVQATIVLKRRYGCLHHINAHGDQLAIHKQIIEIMNRK